MVIGLTGLLGFFVFLVILIVKTIKGKPKKTALIGVLVCLALFAVGLITDRTPNETPGKENYETVAQTLESKEPEETKSAFSFIIENGEAGDYGELFTLNKGTEFEYTFYVYCVPAGTYNVLNLSCEPWSQFTVYKKTIHTTEEGIEEFDEAGDGATKLVKIGETVSVTIQEGEIVKFPDPGKSAELFQFDLVE